MSSVMRLHVAAHAAIGERYAVAQGIEQMGTRHRIFLDANSVGCPRRERRDIGFQPRDGVRDVRRRHEGRSQAVARQPDQIIRGQFESIPALDEIVVNRAAEICRVVGVQRRDQPGVEHGAQRMRRQGRHHAEPHIRQRTDRERDRP